MKFLLNSFLTISTLMIILSGCGIKVDKIEETQIQTKPETQQAASIANNHSLTMHYEVKHIDKSNATSIVTWTIKNTGEDTLHKTGWTLFFNQIAASVDEASLPNTISIRNVKGDFHQLQPTENFKGLAAGDSIVFNYLQNYPILRESFLPKEPYIVYENDMINRNVKFIYKPFDLSLYKDFNVPTAQSRYKANNALKLLNQSQLNPIIPSPFIFNKNDQSILFKDSLIIAYDASFEQEAKLLKKEITKLFTGKIKMQLFEKHLEGNVIRVTNKRKALPEEAYNIASIDNRLLLEASDKAGMFYAMQSLKQLINGAHKTLPANQLKLDGLVAYDKPAFQYRGLMIDVSRNFHSKETLLEIIENMAYYKLNKLHLHLTDDEGWRIEIDGLPELTDVGAKRGHTIDESNNLYPFYSSGPEVQGSYGTGYFTKEDFIEILKYANDRHIEVIPEIDLPGHIRAGIVAMRARYNHYKKLGDMEKAEEYLLEDFDDESVYKSAQGYNDNAMCVCKESAFTFIEKVVDEMANMYEEASVPFKVFHSGGDEVAYGAWQKSPICKNFIASNEDIKSADDLHAYTLKRLKTILAKHNLTSAGWEEIVLKHTNAGHQGTAIDTAFVKENVQPYVWNAVWGWGREDMTYKLANLGFKVVMCNSAQLYLDMAYNTDPNEIGLSWSGYTNTKSPYDLVPYDIYKTAKVDDYVNFIKEKEHLTKAGKQNLLGIQGQVWSETLTSKANLQYMLYPKMLALAERAWSSTERWDLSSYKEVFNKQQTYWNKFANRLGQQHLPKLDEQAINYRIPLPGAIIENDTLYANVAFPGLSIKYTTDGSEPNMDSETYSKPITVNDGVIKLRTFTSNDRGSRVSKLLVK